MVNLGRAPHDSDNIQDFWYALEESGANNTTADPVVIPFREGF